MRSAARRCVSTAIVALAGLMLGCPRTTVAGEVTPEWTLFAHDAMKAEVFQRDVAFGDPPAPIHLAWRVAPFRGKPAVAYFHATLREPRRGRVLRHSGLEMGPQSVREDYAPGRVRLCWEDYDWRDRLDHGGCRFVEVATTGGARMLGEAESYALELRE